MENMRDIQGMEWTPVGWILAAGVAITVGLWVWLETVGIVLGGATPLILGDFPVVRDVSIQLLRAAFAVCVTVVWLRQLGVSSPFEWLGLRRPMGWEWAYIPLSVVLMLVAVIGTTVLIGSVLGLERTAVGGSLSEAVLRSRVVTLLVLVGPAEELLFRGLLQRSLREVIGSWPAILVAGVLFGVGHVELAATTPGDLLWLGGLSLLGIVLGWTYERTDTLVVPALGHGAFNSFTTALPLLLG